MFVNIWSMARISNRRKSYGTYERVQFYCSIVKECSKISTNAPGMWNVLLIDFANLLLLYDHRGHKKKSICLVFCQKEKQIQCSLDYIYHKMFDGRIVSNIQYGCSAFIVAEKKNG